MSDIQHETNFERLKEVLDLLKAVKEKGIKNQEEFQIDVTTPIVGGSSRVGQVDPLMPIRSPSVRGHLRFWWRATRGARFLNVDELYAYESRIFGSSAVPSPVKIWVEVEKVKPQPALCNDLKKVRYVAFPFLDASAKCTYAPVDKELRFTLYIQYQEHSADGGALSIQELREELHTALWAWIQFGGVGARTRRGFGSLYCEKLAAKKGSNLSRERMVDWLKQEFGKRRIELGVQREWPTLGEIMIGGHCRSHRDAWEQVANKYRSFRRRADQKNGPGRSHWPEADSIRHLTGMKLHGHHIPFPSGKTLKVAFPRAALGMPIVFAFHNKDTKDLTNRDPFTSQLVPVGADRLASPLIVKSLAIDKQKGYSAIIRLNQPQIQKVQLQFNDKRAKEKRAEQLKLKDVENKVSKISITAEHIYPNQAYANNPLQTEEGGAVISNAVEAFLKSKEVTEWGTRLSKDR